MSSEYYHSKAEVSYSNPVYTDLLNSDSYYSEIPESWNPRPGQNLPDRTRTTGSSIDKPEVIVGQATGNESGYEQLPVSKSKIENPPSTVVSGIEQKGRVEGEEGCCRRHRCCIGCFIGSSITIFVIAVVVTVVLVMILGLPWAGNRDNQQDCNDVLSKNRSSISGVYRVYPGKKSATEVFCDMETPGGPWLVFQRRKDGSVDFFRNWKNYTNGFKGLDGEFWLGNENLYLLTSTKRYKLRVDLEYFEGNKSYAEYSSFSISSSNDHYQMSCSGYSGNAGDSLNYHNGQRFSTKDADHDSDSSKSCADERRGAWWYDACTESNLNGLYLRGNFTTPYAGGVVWYTWRGAFYSLKTTEMKISRIDLIKR